MDNNLEQFSDEELYIITDYLVKSAKTRFNYTKFRKSLSQFDEEFIDFHFINTIVMSKAGGLENHEIAARILPNVLLSGYNVEIDELVNIVNQKETDLGLEILAAQIAMDSLQNGTHPNLVVQQISKIL
ncbi:hypothetical protein [Nonlabens xiamenensis]|uniref:hypothetical protein n=1 Tax=Nonlabens xiamenensis TaxID=2341043 RepID=UPI000F60677E|nr:hypothetical protein [Nonlabens xiamenensis]